LGSRVDGLSAPARNDGAAGMYTQARTRPAAPTWSAARPRPHRVARCTGERRSAAWPRVG